MPQPAEVSAVEALATLSVSGIRFQSQEFAPGWSCRPSRLIKQIQSRLNLPPMMKLSLMEAIDRTIADTGESPLADQLLSAWPHDFGSAQFFRMSANVVFTFTQTQQTRILRFNHETERSVERIHSEIAYLQYLAAAGLAVAQPIPSLSNRYVETMNTPYGRFHSVVFEAVAGEQFDIDELSLEQFNQWGQALGKLHAAAQFYTQAGRPTWHSQVTEVVENLPASELAIHKAIAQLCSRLNALPVTPQTFGLIHFDFELDNLIWTEQGLVAIDFDDSAWYWFVADIAFALRDLFDDEVAKIDSSNESFQAFVAGYQTEKSITADELSLIPLFLTLHHAIGFGQLNRALEVELPADAPIWATTLRQKLEAIAQKYRHELIHSFIE
ncbi:MAG: phosphotransferase [Cyanobacteria bacterium P01_C01_bin.120]